MSSTSKETSVIDRFLTQAVERVYPSAEALKERLVSGVPLTVYYGIDPTGPTLHLGHMINMKKLATLQELGHRVILLIGDFTATIGDPTDKKATRKQLTREQVLENYKLYQQQAARILKFDGSNPTILRYNSDWLSKMTFEDVIKLAAHYTVQQMLERDMFERRMEANEPIALHEFLYPLMQGYDSVALDVDLEIGGNDQTFNMLAGRTLMREIKNKEKFVLAGKLLVDPSGKKMGKTEGNMIALTDAPEDMYGKIMSWPDEMIEHGFELCTDMPSDQLSAMREALKNGENPMKFKRELAHAIVKWLVGQDAADGAAEHFTRVHQERERPTEMTEVRVLSDGEQSLVDLLVATELVSSKTDARRQIEQGGIKVDDAVVSDPKAIISIPSTGRVLQKGKRHFVRVLPKL